MYRGNCTPESFIVRMECTRFSNAKWNMTQNLYRTETLSRRWPAVAPTSWFLFLDGEEAVNCFALGWDFSSPAGEGWHVPCKFPKSVTWNKNALNRKQSGNNNSAHAARPWFVVHINHHKCIPGGRGVAGRKGISMEQLFAVQGNSEVEDGSKAPSCFKGK